MASLTDEAAVNNLRNYLRIRSVHPNVNYDECINFLKEQARQLGLPVKVYEPLPKKPVLVMTWEGQEPALPSILLNSHMDVVPVYEKSWLHPPFEAHIEDGIIYGRGVQDMKSVAIQYIEAVRRLKAKGVQPKRTVHLSFVPDEEIGGHTGMAEFVKTDGFKSMNVGFALDEGMASPNDEFYVYNGERTIYNVRITCAGKSGHGSLLLPDNSGEKFRYIIDKFMDMRRDSQNKLESDPKLTIGDVTSVNLTMVSGGIQANVIPESLTATFNVRLELSFKPEDFEKLITQWCCEAGPNVTIEYLQRDQYVEPTKLDDTNVFWLAFKSTADKMNLKLSCRTFPGGTDSRYVRLRGVPALGFSPLAGARPALHEHNESLPVNVYLRGIHIYEQIIPAVTNA